MEHEDPNGYLVYSIYAFEIGDQPLGVAAPDGRGNRTGWKNQMGQWEVGDISKVNKTF